MDRPIAALKQKDFLLQLLFILELISLCLALDSKHFASATIIIVLISFFVLMEATLKKDFLSKEDGVLLFSGFMIGLILDWGLSPEFKRQGWFLIVIFTSWVAMSLVSLIYIGSKFRSIGFCRKARVASLGVSLVSVIIAIAGFISFYASYLSEVIPWEETHSWQTEWYTDPSLIFNVVKSILLASLFSFIERYLKLYEERANGTN
jgi:hypothetical protein